MSNATNLTLRAYHGLVDHPAMIALTNACHRHEGVEEFETAESLQHFLHFPHSDPEYDIIVAENAEGIIGYAHTFWRKNRDNSIVHYVFVFVHPDQQRQGVGTRLFAQLQHRIAALKQQTEPNSPHLLLTYVQEKEAAAQAFVNKHGFSVARYLYEMVCPLEHLPNCDDYPLPAHIELRPALPAHDRAIYNARREAFLDHWGSALPSEEEFQAWINDEQRDPSRYVIAWANDEVAGMVLNEINHSENEASGRKRGYTDPIAVRRPWRKQGLATAMLVRSLHLLRQHGMSEAALSVDTENPSGALRIYERLGFKAVKKIVAYQKL